jgi:hypothetical protein
MRPQNTKFHFDNFYWPNPVDYGCIKVIQIGDLCCSGKYYVDLHTQESHEISYIVSGTGYFFKDGAKYHVKSGDVFLTPIGCNHSILSSDQNPLRFFYCAFVFDKHNPEYENFRAFEKLLNTKINPITVDRYNLHSIFTNIFTEIMQDFDTKNIIIKSCLDQLLIFTERNYTRMESPNNRIDNDVYYAKSLVYDIVNFIDSNIQNIKKLTDVSDYVGYSYSHVSQVFSGIYLSPRSPVISDNFTNRTLSINTSEFSPLYTSNFR